MIDKEILDNFVNGFNEYFLYIADDSIYEEHRDKISFMFVSNEDSVHMCLEICIYDVSNNPAYFDYLDNKYMKYMGYITCRNLLGIHKKETEFPEYYAEEDWSEETGYPDGYEYEHNGIMECISDNINDLLYNLIDKCFARIEGINRMIPIIGGRNMIMKAKHNAKLNETLNELE